MINKPFIIRFGENLDCDECKQSFFPNSYQRWAKQQGLRVFCKKACKKACNNREKLNRPRGESHQKKTAEIRSPKNISVSGVSTAMKNHDDACKCCGKKPPEAQFRMNKGKLNRKCNDCILKARLANEEPEIKVAIRYSDYKGTLTPKNLYDMLVEKTKNILGKRYVTIKDVQVMVVEKTSKPVSYTIIRTLHERDSVGRNLAAILAEFLEIDVHRIKLNPFFRNDNDKVKNSTGKTTSAEIVYFQKGNERGMCSVRDFEQHIFSGMIIKSTTCKARYYR